MPSERVQRQIERYLDEAEAAIDAGDWTKARERSEAVLRLDPENADAQTYLAAAGRGTASASTAQGDAPPTASSTTPDSFANGRYVVKRFLGEGGKKRVYLAHDTLL